MKTFYIKLMSILFILCLSIVVYFNTFFSSFHFDDNLYIINDPAIRNFQHLENIWKICPCRFITFLSFALDYHCHRLHVVGYHLFNLAVHAGSGVLVWWLVLLTLSTPVMKSDKITRHAHFIALLSGLIFVSHPVQIEAVTYIWQRAASMATLFYLASLCLYVQSRLLEDTNSKAVPVFYYSSLAMAVFAMFTKETAVTLPVMIVLYEYCFLNLKQVINWRRTAPFLITLLIIPVTMVLTKSERFKEIRGIVEGPAGITPLHYLFTQFRVIVTYIRLSFFPFNQNLDYDYPIFKSIFELPSGISLVCIITILYGAKQLFYKYRLISFSILWFFLTLLPESSLLPQKDLIFEHRLYLPLAGYSLFLVSSVYYLWGKTSLKGMVMALALVIACYSVLTYQRNQVWKNEIVLWEDTVQKSPYKARPYTNLGIAYFSQGRIADALSMYNKAIDIDPGFIEAYYNRGVLYKNLGHSSRAIADFTKAVEINRDYEKAYNNRGLIYAQQGDFSRALTDYNNAIDIDPDFAESYNNRGLVYAQQRKFQQAIAEFTKAISINPFSVEEYNNRGNIYAYEGKYAMALADFLKGLDIDPGNAETYCDCGNVYFQQGRFDQAVIEYSKAIEIDPKFAQVYNNRATAYFYLKKYNEAWGDVNKARRAGVVVDPPFLSELKKVTESVVRAAGTDK